MSSPIQWVLDFLGGLAEAVADVIERVVDWVVARVNDAVRIVTAPFVWLFDAVAHAIERFYIYLLAVAHEAIQWALTGLGEIYNTIRQWALVVLDIVAAWLQNVADRLEWLITIGIEHAVNVATTYYNNLVTTINQLRDWLTDPVGGFLGYILDRISDLATWTEQQLANLRTWVDGRINDLATWTQKQLDMLWDRVVTTTVERVGERLWDVVEWWFDRVWPEGARWRKGL